MSHSERCATRSLINFNAEYNPEGKYPVITFCDGHHSDPDQVKKQCGRVRRLKQLETDLGNALQLIS